MKPQRQLATYYYQEHFLELLHFVKNTYQNILNEEQFRFISDFQNLSRNEQCLYVRMANRKGHIFHKQTLLYQEIDDFAQAQDGLSSKGFTRALQEDDYRSWLASLKKDQLLSRARIPLKSHWSKIKIIQLIAEQVCFSDFCQQVSSADYFVQGKLDSINFILFLYFGRPQENLNQFALRDLGIVRVHQNREYSARFDNREEAHTCYFYQSTANAIRNRELMDYDALFKQLSAAQNPESDEAQTLLAKCRFLLGEHFECQGDANRACHLFELSDHSKSKQRLVRLKYNDGNKEEVQRLLTNIIQDPATDEDYYFALDFQARKFESKKLSTQTHLLRNGEAINIDEAHRDNPEFGAQCLYQQQGWTTWHAENAPWRCLFGLLFWDELFSDSRALHSGFERMPQCLKNRSFAQIFSNEIEKKLCDLRNHNILPRLLKTLSAFHGQPNGVLAWHMVDIDMIKPLIQPEYREATASILLLMSKNFEAMKDGFPDLLLTKHNELKFIEIKTEGDVLRRHQLTRFKQLQSAGFNCEIVKVNYRFNPRQTYVVVDIETTGGRKAHHRITEIGAVKICNHEVVGQWHSLINPQRPIPASITRLTGIQNAMVADAPLFGEIAENFRNFVGNAIFVAHNVNFDYGFIAAEFQRLDQVFKHPKFCTCSNMRKFYPKLESYSLDNLCREFEIPLHNHHRALDDAKAAAALLNLINVKRETEAQSPEHLHPSTY